MVEYDCFISICILYQSSNALFFLIYLLIFTIIIIEIKIGVITVKRHITMIWMGCYIRNKLLLLLLLLVCFIQ